jgi:hypothetical protein
MKWAAIKSQGRLVYYNYRVGSYRLTVSRETPSWQWKMFYYEPGDRSSGGVKIAESEPTFTSARGATEAALFTLLEVQAAALAEVAGDHR